MRVSGSVKLATLWKERTASLARRPFAPLGISGVLARALRMDSACRAAVSQRTLHTESMQSQPGPWSRLKSQATAVGPAIMDITSMGRPVTRATRRFDQQDSIEVDAHRLGTAHVLCAVCLFVLLECIDEAAHQTLTRPAPTASTSPVTRPM